MFIEIKFYDPKELQIMSNSLVALELRTIPVANKNGVCYIVFFIISAYPQTLDSDASSSTHTYLIIIMNHSARTVPKLTELTLHLILMTPSENNRHRSKNNVST